MFAFCDTPRGRGVAAKAWFDRATLRFNWRISFDFYTPHNWGTRVDRSTHQLHFLLLTVQCDIEHFPVFLEFRFASLQVHNLEILAR